MKEPKADDELLAWLDALCSESITAEQLVKLEARLKSDPAARQQYFAYVDVHVGLRRLSLTNEEAPARPLAIADLGQEPARRSWQTLAALAAGILLAVLVGLYAADRGGLFGPLAGEPAPGKAPSTDPAPPNPNIPRLASVAGARFFGELAPPIHSQLEMRRDYVLMNGLVEVAFASGASAIIEGPAVFRILSATSLGLDVGLCSVHCPPGAEGFRVETQLVNVVDRGTRFSVKVGEASETEIHVVEGFADLYPLPPSNAEPIPLPAAPAEPTRIGSEETIRYEESQAGRALGAPSVSYRTNLPDRVISYEATQAKKGGVLNLTSLTVQRDGKPRRYLMDELIRVETIGFCGAGDAADKNGHLSGDEGPLRGKRPDPLADDSLITGLINPGGSVQPLATDPVIPPRAVFPGDRAAAAPPPNTLGLAVRFKTAVINRAGPDVVLFEMQTVTNPADGDAFHVSPLRFAEGLRSHTIRAFDIAMTSSEAQKLAEFHLFRYEVPIRSLEQLDTTASRMTPARRNFRMLAVGIDLSQLGYAEGAAVEGLFFQDAADDDHKVDPVLIAGFPE